MICCWTGTTCAVLPCKNSLSRGSPETVNTAVALQLESKTCTLVAAAVGVVVLARASSPARAWPLLGLCSCCSSSWSLLGNVEGQEQ